MRPFSAYVQPAGSMHEYELEIRHDEQRYLIRRDGLLVDGWQAASGPRLTPQQLLDLARAAVTSALGAALDRDG